MNEIYDRIDSCIESIMPISDYKIKIDMRFKSDNHSSRADVDPPYDSDVDYGTVGGFLPEQEVIHDIRFHVGFDANHMHFEHINTLVHCLVDAIFDMKNHTYNVTGPIYMSMLHFVVDDIKFSVQ